MTVPDLRLFTTPPAVAAIMRMAIAVSIVAFAAALTGPAQAAGTTLKVSLWGEMSGLMPTNMGMAMSKRERSHARHQYQNGHHDLSK